MHIISFYFYTFIFVSLFLAVFFYSHSTPCICWNTISLLCLSASCPRGPLSRRNLWSALWPFGVLPVFVSFQCRLGGRRYLCSDSQARPNRNMNLYHFLVVVFPSLLLCFFCTGKFLEHNVIYSWELCAKKDATKQSTSRRIGANRGSQQKGIGRGIGRKRESGKVGERARHETQIQDDS